MSAIKGPRASSKAVFSLNTYVSNKPAGRPTDPNSWALLADIHLSADRARLARGINMADHCQSGSRELIALPKRPAVVFISGDCSFNSGQKEC